VDEALDRVARALTGRAWIANLWLAEGMRAESSGGRLSEAERFRSGALTVEVEESPGRVGFAQAPLGGGDLDAEGLASRALASARARTADPAVTIPETLDPIPQADLALRDPAYDRLTIDDAAAWAARLEEAARGADPRVFSVRKPSFQAEDERRLIRLHTGETREWRATSFSLHAETGARQGEDAQSGFAAASARFLSSLDAAAVGREAAVRAVELLGAEESPSGSFPALLDARVARDVLELLAPSLLGRTHEKGKSLFQGKVGKRVFGERVDVWDDGLLRGGADTQPLDDEGSARRRTGCVRGGVLEKLLHDRASARRAGTATTGNGAAGERSPVEPDATNLYIGAGAGGTAREMLARMGRGLWVREVMGLHTVDEISGDFSLGCSGLWIERGEVARPFTGAAVSGNLLDLLLRIEEVGGDLTFEGSVGAPSLLLGAIDFAGG
jgi:PmbA protein